MEPPAGCCLVSDVLYIYLLSVLVNAAIVPAEHGYIGQILNHIYRAFAVIFKHAKSVQGRNLENPFSLVQGKDVCYNTTQICAQIFVLFIFVHKFVKTHICLDKYLHTYLFGQIFVKKKGVNFGK